MTRWPVVLAAGGLVAAGWWIGVTIYRRSADEDRRRMYQRLLNTYEPNGWKTEPIIREGS